MEANERHKPQALHSQLVRNIGQNGRQKSVPDVVAAAVIDERDGVVAARIRIRMDRQIQRVRVKKPFEIFQMLHMSQITVAQIVLHEILGGSGERLLTDGNDEMTSHAQPQETAFQEQQCRSPQDGEKCEEKNGVQQKRARVEQLFLNEEIPPDDNDEPERGRDQKPPHFVPGTECGAK